MTKKLPDQQIKCEKTGKNIYKFETIIHVCVYTNNTEIHLT